MKESMTILPPAKPALHNDFVYIPNNRMLLRYRQIIYKYFAYANNFGLALDDDDLTSKHGKPVLLSKLFVPPRLAEQHIEPEQIINDEMGENLNRQESSLLNTVLIDNQRLFILGNPGTGKSTLINWLMLELSYSGDNATKSSLGSIVPFAFILRNIDLSKVKTWDDLYQSWLKGNPELALIMEDEPDVMEQMLASGQALFLLDGLDEVSNEDNRNNIGLAIIDGFSRHPRCRFVITSRILGFSQKELMQLKPAVSAEENISFEIKGLGGKKKTNLLPCYYLAPFDKVQTDKFSKNWFNQYVVDSGDRAERVKNLLARLGQNDGLSTLARIPVLLNIICFIHARRGQLPDGRAELYRRISETYLIALDKARGVKFQDREIPLDYSDIHRCLGQVALKIQEGRDADNNTVSISKVQVANIFEEGLEDAGLEPEEAILETEFILSYIAERSGLFVPKGNSEKEETLFAFSHLSFMEYFAASELRNMVEFWKQDGEEWQNLRAKMNVPLWSETLVLFFEQMDSSSQVEHYLARLIGHPLGDESSLEEFLGKSVDYPDDDAALRWSLVATIVMDIAVKFKSKIRTNYIKGLWFFVLTIRPILSNGLQHKMLRSLWSSKHNSLDLFQEQLKNQTSLQLESELITDISFLEEAKGIENLSLIDVAVLDLQPLASLSNLMTLTLLCKTVGDLKPLSGLTKITILRLYIMPVKDIECLGGLLSLTDLTLMNLKVSDLYPLENLTKLTSLDINSNPVKDLQPLSSMTNLTSLYFSGTSVKDLLPLAGLSKLRQLYLDKDVDIDLDPLKGLNDLKIIKL